MSEDPEFEETTDGILVAVRPQYLDDQSDPDEGRYVWAYHVRIENHGEQSVQLITRHWQITDATGSVHEVRGDGVVGEQPVLAPGEMFEYSSGTPLATPTGFMAGSYQMVSASGERFDARVPAFSLDSPHHQAQLH